MLRKNELILLKIIIIIIFKLVLNETSLFEENKQVQSYILVKYFKLTSRGLMYSYSLYIILRTKR